MTFLDANVIIRYVTQDEPQKTARCEQLFKKVEAGTEALLIHVLIVAEVIWVLTGVYRLTKERVVDALLELLSMEAIHLDDKERVLTALDRYRAKPVDFIDAYHAQYLLDKKLDAVYSYDRDFDILPGLRRLEP